MAFLNKLHDQSLELLRDVKFDKQPQRDGYLVCLYASMIELCGGIILLVGKDRRTSVSPVFRTLLEAYVDFKNVSEDPTYVKHCYARHHRDWIKVLSNNQRPNPFLAGIHGHEERDATLERHKREFQRLKEEGVRPLKTSERFKRAGMADEYLSIYHFESDAIHNSWQALLDRHFEKVDNGFELALYKERSLDDYATYLDSSAVLLLDATNKIHQRFKSGRQQTALREELAALQAKARS